MADLGQTPQREATEKEVLQMRVKKEQRDVEKTLATITVCMKGIAAKEAKVQTASTKVLAKKYKKQIKSSKAYLKDLMGSLQLELLEHAHAEYELERLEE